MPQSEYRDRRRQKTSPRDGKPEIVIDRICFENDKMMELILPKAQKSRLHYTCPRRSRTDHRSFVLKIQSPAPKENTANGHMKPVIVIPTYNEAENIEN